MKSEEESSVIQSIQPQCASLYEHLKHEKNLRGETNRTLAYHTGVSESTIRNFFAGSLASPCIYDVAAICKYLHVSLDDLMSIEADGSGEGETVRELERQVESAEKELEQARMYNRYFFLGMRERKNIIYALSIICLLLTLSLISYIAVDINNLSFGFFTAGGVSFAGVAIAAVLLVAAGAGGSSLIRRHREKKAKR